MPYIFKDVSPSNVLSVATVEVWAALKMFQTCTVIGPTRKNVYVVLSDKPRIYLALTSNKETLAALPVCSESGFTNSKLR